MQGTALHTGFITLSCKQQRLSLLIAYLLTPVYRVPEIDKHDLLLIDCSYK